MRVQDWPIGRVRPYEGNPRRNDDAVPKVAASIEKFGWRQPIVVDADGVIIAGHTRYKAAQALGLETVPVVVASDLTPEQCAAYRLADNKTAELAEWDYRLLAEELDGLANLDMSAFGFTEGDIERTIGGIDFSAQEGMSEHTDEYDEFVDKFKLKKTTDDCYTPAPVYDAVLNWSCSEYGIDPEKVVRPFYPGGDYEKFDYSGGKVVVDNPPFSILSQIIDFYLERGVPFFLFAPALTLFSGNRDCNYIASACDVTYENGAVVRTSFVTSFGEWKIDTAPELRRMVGDAMGVERVGKVAYELPDEVITSARLDKLALAGIRLQVPSDQCRFVRALDNQREMGKALYGGGFLVSESVAEEKAEAEREARRISAERAVGRLTENGSVRIELSDREREIVRSLGGCHEWRAVKTTNQLIRESWSSRSRSVRG